MTEFRWLERKVPTHRIEFNTFTGEATDLGPTGDMHWETVLQFREKVMQMGRVPVGAGDGNTYVMHEKPMGWQWTEWKDVPTVRDASSCE